MISRRNFLKACAAAASAATLSSALAGGPPAIPPPAPATSATIRSLGARNNLIATVGDSLTAHGVGWSNATITVKRSRGWQTWAAQASGQRVVFRPDLNFALAGRTTTDIIYTAEPSLGGKTQLQCAIDSPADTVHVMAGTNDFNLSVLNSITLANYALILRALLAAGKRVIWAVSPPSGSPAFPSARRPAANATSAMIARRWIMDLTGMPNVFPYDTWPLMEDQSAAGVAGDYIGDQTVDGTHYTTRGGYTHGALCLAPLLMQIFPSVSILPASEIDAFNATSNPGGNLIGNPYMRGTTGTMATSATGVVATGATLDAAVSDLTVAGSIVTDAPGARWERMGISGATATANARPKLKFAMSTANFAPGGTYEFIVQYSVEAGATGVLAVAALLNIAVDGVTYGAIDGDPWLLTDGLIPAVAHGGILRTPPITITGSTVTSAICCVQAHCQQNVPVAANINVRGGYLRRVA